MSTTRSMNFQAYLENTYRIIKAEPIILILGGLIVQLLTILTMGILAGPFLGGYFLLIIYYFRENRKPTFNDIFSGLQQFANLLPYFLVLLTIFIGFMLLILPGFLLATWWLYVLPLMVDRKISFSEAMKISTKKVNETGFLMHFVFLLLVSVIPILILNFLSAMIPFLFVLKLLLPPFQVGCLASLYVDQFGEDDFSTGAKEEVEPKTHAAAPPLHKANEADNVVKEEEIMTDESETIPGADTEPEMYAKEHPDEEQSLEPEQPVTEEAKTSDQSASESLPEENILDEKSDQGDNAHLNQAEEESDLDSEKDNKDTI